MSGRASHRNHKHKHHRQPRNDSQHTRLPTLVGEPGEHPHNATPLHRSAVCARTHVRVRGLVGSSGTDAGGCDAALPTRRPTRHLRQLRGKQRAQGAGKRSAAGSSRYCTCHQVTRMIAFAPGGAVMIRCANLHTLIRTKFTAGGAVAHIWEEARGLNGQCVVDTIEDNTAVCTRRVCCPTTSTASTSTCPSLRPSSSPWPQPSQSPPALRGCDAHEARTCRPPCTLLCTQHRSTWASCLPRT